MGVRVVTTAYGRPALESLREVVAQAKADDPMARVTVIVPGQLAGVAARRYLATAGVHPGRRGIAGLTVTTLPRLAEQLATGGLAPRRPLTRAVLSAAWRAALDHAPGTFAPVAAHPATLRALVHTHHELRDLSPAGRAAVAATTPDVVRLHDTVRGALAPDWYDPVDLLTEAARRVAAATRRTGGQDRASHPGLVLHLPQDLSGPELALVRALSGAPGDLVVIAGLSGDDDADRPAHRFLAGLRPRGVRPPRRPGPPPPGPRPARAAEVLHAADADDEVRCVVRRVVSALGEDEEHLRIRAHRIAVLHTGGPYPRLLHAHLGAAGITVNGPGAEGVRDRALARGFLGVLALAGTRFGRDEVFAALAAAPLRDTDGRPVPVARWERAARAAGVVGGRDWRRLEDEGSGLWRWVIDLGRRLQDGDASDTWARLGRWALDLFHDCYGTHDDLAGLPPGEQCAAVAIEHALTAAAALDGVGTTPSVSALHELLDLDLTAAQPRVGRFGEGVFVGPLSAAPGLDVDLIVVAGLAQDACPGRAAADPLLPDAVRAATGELATRADDVRRRHHLLLAAFAAAPALASFPRGDLRRSTERRPSRWLDPSLAELPDHHVTAARSFPHGISRTDAPAGEHEWRVRAAAGGVDLARELHDPVVAAATALLRGRDGNRFTRFDGNLARVGHAGGLPDFAHDAGTVSPTSLEAYATCPHAWFVGRLLGVHPVASAEEAHAADRREIGLLVHRCLDRLVTESASALPGFGEPWGEGHRVRLQEIAAEEADALERTGVTGHPLPWRTERDQVAADLAAALDADDAFRRERDAAVVGTELRFGLDPDGPAAVGIPVARGTVRLSGSADRVDRARDGTVIVTDVKTGSARSYLPVRDDPVAAGTRLQLPAYAWAAARALGAQRVQARYEFVRRDAGTTVGLVLDEPVRARYAAAVGTLVDGIADGLFPPRPPAEPDVGPLRCAWCDPDGLGHHEARVRYERKRSDPALAGLLALIDPRTDPVGS